MDFSHFSLETSKLKKRQNPEAKLKVARFKYHEALIKFLIPSTILQQIVINAINPFKRSLFDPKFLALNAILIALVLLGIYLVRKKSLHCEKCMVLMIAVLLVYLLELKMDLYTIWPKNIFFTFGALYQLLLLSMPLARVSWKSSTFVGFFINILFLTRYLDYEENSSSKYFTLSLFSLIVVGVSISSYFLEKYERQNFLQVRKLKINQKRLMNLILDVLPSAALVIKSGKIISTNDKVEKMFNGLNNDDILRETKNIKITSNFNENEKGIPSFIFAKREISEENKISEQNELICNNANENEGLTLFDIINLRAHSKLKKYIGAIVKTDGISVNDAVHYVDISASKILWNDEEAVFLFINENEMAQKYNELDRQAKYKDKLLATVSHDLRTPLNGIIGMIKLALGSVIDDVAKERF